MLLADISILEQMDSTLVDIGKLSLNTAILKRICPLYPATRGEGKNNLAEIRSHQKSDINCA